MNIWGGVMKALLVTLVVETWEDLRFKIEVKIFRTFVTKLLLIVLFLKDL